MSQLRAERVILLDYDPHHPTLTQDAQDSGRDGDGDSISSDKTERHVKKSDIHRRQIMHDEYGVSTGWFNKNILKMNFDQLITSISSFAFSTYFGYQP